MVDRWLDIIYVHGIGFSGEEIMQSFQAHETLHHCQVTILCKICVFVKRTMLFLCQTCKAFCHFQMTTLCKTLYLIILLHLNLFHIVTIQICYILSYKFCIVIWSYEFHVVAKSYGFCLVAFQAMNLISLHFKL